MFESNNTVTERPSFSTSPLAVYIKGELIDTNSDTVRGLTRTEAGEAFFKTCYLELNQVTSSDASQPGGCVKTVSAIVPGNYSTTFRHIYSTDGNEQVTWAHGEYYTGVPTQTTGKTAGDTDHA